VDRKVEEFKAEGNLIYGQLLEAMFLDIKEDVNKAAESNNNQYEEKSKIDGFLSDISKLLDIRDPLETPKILLDAASRLSGPRVVKVTISACTQYVKEQMESNGVPGYAVAAIDLVNVLIVDFMQDIDKLIVKRDILLQDGWSMVLQAMDPSVMASPRHTMASAADGDDRTSNGLVQQMFTMLFKILVENEETARRLRVGLKQAIEGQMTELQAEGKCDEVLATLAPLLVDRFLEILLVSYLDPGQDMLQPDMLPDLLNAAVSGDKSRLLDVCSIYLGDELISAVINASLKTACQRLEKAGVPPEYVWITIKLSNHLLMSPPTEDKAQTSLLLLMQAGRLALEQKFDAANEKFKECAKELLGEEGEKIMEALMNQAVQAAASALAEKLKESHIQEVYAILGSEACYNAAVFISTKENGPSIFQDEAKRVLDAVLQQDRELGTKVYAFAAQVLGENQLNKAISLALESFNDALVVQSTKAGLSKSHSALLMAAMDYIILLDTKVAAKVGPWIQAAADIAQKLANVIANAAADGSENSEINALYEDIEGLGKEILGERATNLLADTAAERLGDMFRSLLKKNGVTAPADVELSEALLMSFGSYTLHYGSDGLFKQVRSVIEAASSPESVRLAMTKMAKEMLGEELFQQVLGRVVTGICDRIQAELVKNNVHPDFSAAAVEIATYLINNKDPELLTDAYTLLSNLVSDITTGKITVEDYRQLVPQRLKQVATLILGQKATDLLLNGHLRQLAVQALTEKFLKPIKEKLSQHGIPEVYVSLTVETCLNAANFMTAEGMKTVQAELSAVSSAATSGNASSEILAFAEKVLGETELAAMLRRMKEAINAELGKMVAQGTLNKVMGSMATMAVDKCAEMLESQVTSGGTGESQANAIMEEAKAALAPKQFLDLVKAALLGHTDVFLQLCKQHLGEQVVDEMLAAADTATLTLTEVEQSPLRQPKQGGLEPSEDVKLHIDPEPQTPQDSEPSPFPSPTKLKGKVEEDAEGEPVLSPQPAKLPLPVAKASETPPFEGSDSDATPLSPRKK